MTGHGKQKEKREETRIRAMPIGKVSANNEPVQQVVLEAQNVELRRTQAELAKSRNRYHDLFDRAPIGYFIINREFKIIGVNLFGAELLGVKRKYLKNKTFTGYISGEETDRFAREFQRAFSPGEKIRLEIKMRRPDGSTFYARLGSVRAGSNELRLALIDITDLKQTEKALEEAESEAQALIKYAPTGIFEFDYTVPGFINANEAICQLTGYSREELFILGPMALLDEDSQKLFSRRIRKQMAGEEIDETVEYKVRKKDGSYIFVTLNIALLETRPHAAMVIAHDITERERAEETIKRHQAELERSNAELQHFAYVASHDLQEPLRMVESYVQLLQKNYQGRLDKDADEFIYYAVDGAKRMRMLIHDLLEYSRVSTQGKPFIPVNVAAVLEKVIETMQVLIAENKAVITHDALPIVQGDVIQVSQLLQNLIGNAIKYRREETPLIHVSCTQQEDEYVFSVRDNGIGIEPAQFNRLFQIFQRLHTSEEYQGTGIGLAISKLIVERHGGRIWVESQPGAGSTFFFTMPVTGIV